MPKLPELVEVEAIEAFTVTRPYGQFHGDPASERNRVVSVPEDALDGLVALGKAKRHKAISKAAESKPADAEKPLSRMNKTELRAVAAAESVEIADDASNKEIKAAIEAKRAAPPVETDEEEQGDDDAPAA